jgi:hypothetical protein
MIKGAILQAILFFFSLFGYNYKNMKEACVKDLLKPSDQLAIYIRNEIELFVWYKKKKR